MRLPNILRRAASMFHGAERATFAKEQTLSIQKIQN
jgi:hypothetical protein